MSLPNNKFLDPMQLQEDLAFSEATLNEAMTAQAGFFAHYARIAAEAFHNVSQLKQLLKVTEAEVAKRVRSDAAVTGIKITEKSIEEEITLDPSVRKVRKALIDAEAVYELARNAPEAFKQRRDMLIQIGADRREELKGELRSKAMSDDLGSAAARLRQKLLENA